MILFCMKNSAHGDKTINPNLIEKRGPFEKSRHNNQKMNDECTSIIINEIMYE